MRGRLIELWLGKKNTKSIILKKIIKCVTKCVSLLVRTIGCSLMQVRMFKKKKKVE